MFKRAMSKVGWMARATTTVVGIVIMAALIFGATTAAFAGSGVGGVFNLGKVNSVERQSVLAGATNTPNLRISNLGSVPGLSLIVGERGTPPAQKTVAPMRVNSQAKVKNLNADLVDGSSAADFLSSDVVVRTDEENLENGDLEATNSTTCDAGEVATGGGAAIVLDGAEEDGEVVEGEFVVAGSRPTFSETGGPATGWQASVLDFDQNEFENGLFTLRVYALCASDGGQQP